MLLSVRPSPGPGTCKTICSTEVSLCHPVSFVLYDSKWHRERLHKCNEASVASTFSPFFCCSNCFVCRKWEVLPDGKYTSLWCMGRSVNCPCSALLASHEGRGLLWQRLLTLVQDRQHEMQKRVRGSSLLPLQSTDYI